MLQFILEGGSKDMSGKGWMVVLGSNMGRTGCVNLSPCCYYKLYCCLVSQLKIQKCIIYLVQTTILPNLNRQGQGLAYSQFRVLQRSVVLVCITTRHVFCWSKTSYMRGYFFLSSLVLGRAGVLLCSTVCKF